MIGPPTRFPIRVQLWHEYGAMTTPDQQRPGRRRAVRPLDGPSLNELALAYAARFASTGKRLERYLARKLRERGWAGEGEPDLAAIAARFAELGYVDDAGYARMRRAALLGRGLGGRRVAQVLAEAGVAGEISAALAPDAGEARRAALRLAERRRFGPFGDPPPDRPLREKQLAAMLRAGHPLDIARHLVNAGDADSARQWAGEPDEE